MKLKALLFATAVFFISCSNDKKITETSKQQSTLKSDILLSSFAHKPFSRSGKTDDVMLSLSGKTILAATATFKAMNEKGEELHCETFLAIDLIQPEYKTANSVLKEAHIREVVEGFFMDDLDFQNIKENTLVGI